MKNKNFMLKNRDEIVIKISNKYIDIPDIIHDKNNTGITKDLLIDEIVVMGIRETIKEIFCRIGEIDSQVVNITTKDYNAILKELKW